jgi:hypothetical protein
VENKKKKPKDKVEKYCDYACEFILSNGKPMMIRKHARTFCQYWLVAREKRKKCVNI